MTEDFIRRNACLTISLVDGGVVAPAEDTEASSEYVPPKMVAREVSNPLSDSPLFHIWDDVGVSIKSSLDINNSGLNVALRQIRPENGVLISDIVEAEDRYFSLAREMQCERTLLHEMINEASDDISTHTGGVGAGVVLMNSRTLSGFNVPECSTFKENSFGKRQIGRWQHVAFLNRTISVCVSDHLRDGVIYVVCGGIRIGGAGVICKDNKMYFISAESDPHQFGNASDYIRVLRFSI